MEWRAFPYRIVRFVVATIEPLFPNALFYAKTIWIYILAANTRKTHEKWDILWPSRRGRRLNNDDSPDILGWMVLTVKY